MWKIRLSVDPSLQATSLMQFMANCQGDWPDAWAPLTKACEVASEELDSEDDRLFDLVQQLEDMPGVEVNFEDVERQSESGEDDDVLYLRRYDVGVDLKALEGEKKRDAAETLRAVARFIHAVEATTGYTLEARLGVPKVDAEDVIERLQEIARERRFSLLPEEEVDISFEETPSQKTTRRPQPEPTQTKSQRSTQPRRRNKFDAAGGSVGGLDDDYTGTPSNARRLLEHEEFFLVQTELAWPSDEPALRAAWKRVAAYAHPDKQPDNPHAHSNFAMLQSGYASLRTRLGVRP